MNKAPTISELIHHLKQCPPEFLAPPLQHGKGEVHSEALLNDIMRQLSHDLTAPQLSKIAAEKRSIAELLMIQICCWLLTHPFFKNIDNRWIHEFINNQLSSIAPLVRPELWVTDEERAEELGRMVLHCSGYLPAGESREEALDRYDSVNTIKRLKVIEESNAANARAQEIRRQMAEKRAREAANVYARE